MRTLPGRWQFLLFVLGAALVAAPAAAQELRGPFQHAPRSVRTRLYDVEHLKLELSFDFDKEEVHGRAVNRLAPYTATDKIELDAAGLVIERVELVQAGAVAAPAAPQPLAHESQGEKLTVRLDRVYQPHEQIAVAIDYKVVKPDRGVHFVTPDAHEPGQLKMVWTQNEPEDARYWMPTFDSPNERMTSEVFVTVPEDFFVLSNGVLKEKGEPKDGRRTWHWVQERSHVPYLISIVAGKFEAYEQTWRGMPVVAYVPPGRMPDAERSFGQTPEMLELFSSKIGYNYPWPKYTQICCDEYGGGMEHTSATTLTLSTLHDERAELDVSSEELVAHELAHQWWGDLLTCKDWGELWLNESFATYFATLWQEHDDGWDAAAWSRYEEAQSYFGEDSGRYRRPIVTYRYNEPINMFDGHSYPKGGRVLHMLRFELGDEAFWQALRHYAHKHEYQVVETADLRVAIEEATGQGMNWFFDQWLDHGGHPEFNVAWQWDESTRQVELTVKQTQKVDQLTPLFRTTVEIELATPSETITRKINVTKAEETFHFELPERPRRVVFDPRDWLLKKLTVEKSREEWLDQLAADPNVIPRVDAAKALGEYTSDETVHAALVKAAKEDSFWAVRREAVRSLKKLGGDKVRPLLIDVARSDKKSFVRREALTSLGDYAHADTAACLRQALNDDPSYYAAAQALRSLVKTEKEKALPDVNAALDRTSHGEVIVEAACDGLVELKDRTAVDRLLAILDGEAPHERRTAVMAALVKLDPGNTKITEALAANLNDGRRSVRVAAIRALGQTGDEKAIDLLLARRAKENWSSPIRAIDDAVEALRNPGLPVVRRQVEALETSNAELKARLEKIEGSR